MWCRSIAAALLLVVAIVGPAQAEPRWHVVEGDNRVLLRAGLDPALGFTVGYGREFPLANTGRNWVLFGEFATTFATFGSNGSLKPRAWLPIVRYKLFRFSTEGTFELGWTHNRNYNSVRLAPGVALLPGIGGDAGRWYVDGEFAYERAIANHVENTDYYREVFYEDARDGWYRGTGSRFRMGLRGGFRIDRWNVEIRLAHDRTERFNFPGGSPFAATLGAGMRF